MAKRIKNMRLSDVGIAFRTNQAVRVVTHQLREKRIDVSGSWSLNDEGNGRDEDWQYLNNTDVKVMTYEKIKGQQFETVFLYVDGELTPEMLKRFYVGVTRAERFLYILYKGSLPSVLRQIPLSLYEKSDVVKSKKTENPSGKDSGPSDGNTLSAADIGF